MNLEWLRCFIILAQTENFSKAAEVLKCSQPSVSRQIRLLEEEVKFQLFIRSQRHVKITDQGRIFLKTIEPLYIQLSAALKISGKEASVPEGTLTIGSLREVGQSVLMPMIVDFYSAVGGHQENKINIHLQYEPSLVLVQNIKMGKMDFAVVRTDPKDSSIRCYPFLNEKIVLITSVKNKKKINDVTKLDFVSHSFNDPVLRAFLKQIKKRIKLEEVRVPFTVNSLQSMLQLISVTDLYAAMPLHHVESAVEENRVKIVSDFQIDNQLYFIHPEKNYSSYLQKLFKAHILAQIKRRN